MNAGDRSPLPLPPLSGAYLEVGSSSDAAPPYSIRSRRSFRDMVGIPLSFSRSGPPPAAPGFFSDDEPHRHFLDSCFLCKKHLGAGCDIFMYRGDTPFCSEECRQEQIEIDEANEKREKMEHALSAKHNEQQRPNTPNQPGIHVRAAAGTVVAG